MIRGRVRSKESKSGSLTENVEKTAELSVDSLDKSLIDNREKPKDLLDYPSTPGFVCSCEKPTGHRNILECQTFRAAKRVQTATNNLSQPQEKQSFKESPVSTIQVSSSSFFSFPSYFLLLFLFNFINHIVKVQVN